MNTKASLLLAAAVALAASLVAVSGRAQQSNGSPDGLYDYPDADQAARNAREAPSHREAETFRDSLDSESRHIKSEAEQAMAVRQDVVARKSAYAQGPQWLPDAIDLSERGWIVLLTASGLLISFSAAGYLWWSRREQSRAPVALLVPMKPRSPSAAPAKENDRKSKRKAA